jgi:hypothetical protein
MNKYFTKTSGFGFNFLPRLLSRAFFAIALIVITFSANAQFGTSPYNAPAGSYTVPTGVTSITVTCYGGGGGGGGEKCSSNSSWSDAGGGGGGACSVTTVTVTPGSTIVVAVGGGGTAGANTGTSGGTGSTSSITISGTVVASAAGGTGGIGVANGGTGVVAGTAAGGSTGTGTIKAGGAGGGGYDGAEDWGGGGGGGGGTSTVGGAGVTATNSNTGAAPGGTGGTAGGGTGGAGAYCTGTSTAGSIGSTYGGGGGGAASFFSKTGAAGGAGAAGAVIITYAVSNPTLVISPTSLTFSANQCTTTPSAGQTFTISGTSLTGYPGNITVTAPSTSYQVSTNNATWGATTTVAYTAATLAATTVYVRFVPQSAATLTGNITFSGGGVSSPPSIAVTGTGVSCTSATGNIYSGDGVNWVGGNQTPTAFTEPTNCSTSPFNLHERLVALTSTGTAVTDGRIQWVNTLNAQASGADVYNTNMNASSTGFLFTSGGGCGNAGSYGNKWGSGSSFASGTLNTANAAGYQAANNEGLNMSTAGYYTFVMKDAGYNATEYYVGYTAARPVAIAAGAVTSTCAGVNIAANLSAAPSSGENVFIRYQVGSNSGFSAGTGTTGATTIVQGTVSGTVATLTLTGLTGGSTIYYYVFTSTESLTNLNAANEGDKAYRLLNYDDNSGNLYSYTVPSATTFTWVGATGGSWATAANWSPASVPCAGSNIIFNSGTTETINNVPTISLASITTATSGTNYTLEPVSGGATITLTNTGTALSIVTGTTLTLYSYTGSAAAALTLNYSGSGNTATIAGTLNLNPTAGYTTAATYNATNSATTISGTLNINDAVSVLTSTASNLTITAAGNVNMNNAAAAVPAATWSSGTPGATLTFGATSTAITFTGLAGQSFYNVTYSGVATTNPSFGGNLTTVLGTLTVTNTDGGTSSLLLTTTTSLTASIANIVVNGGKLFLTYGTAAATVNVSGNVTVTSSNLFVSGAAGTGTLNVTGNLLVNGGTINSSFGAGNAILNVTGTSTFSSGYVYGSLSTGTCTFNLTGAVTISGATVNLSNNSSTAATCVMNINNTTSSALTVSSGILTLLNSSVVGAGGSATLTLAASSTFTISGGTVYMNYDNSAAYTAVAATINCYNFVMTSGTLFFNDEAAAKPSGILNVAGNFSATGSSEISNAYKPYGEIIFNGATQNLINTSTGVSELVSFSILSPSICTLTGAFSVQDAAETSLDSFIINSGATLNCSTFAVNDNASGYGRFYNYGTLGIGSPLGIVTLGSTTGNVTIGSTAHGVRSFGAAAGANYTYNGTAAQVTGTGLPTSFAGNLTISNTVASPAGVTLTAATAVGGLALNSGLLILGANSLTNNGALTGGSSTSYILTQSTGDYITNTSTTASTVLPLGSSDNLATATTSYFYDPLTIGSTASAVTLTSNLLIGAIRVPGSPLLPLSIAVPVWNVTSSATSSANITYNWLSGNDSTTYAATGPTTLPADLGVWNGSTYVAASLGTPTGSGTAASPYTVAASAVSLPTGTNEWIIGAHGSIVGAVVAPIILSFTPTSGYTGTPVTLTGTGLSSLSSASIGGTAATITAQSVTSATLAVGAGSTGLVSVTNSGGTGTSALDVTPDFTYLGYITTANGDWSAGATWLGGSVPPAGAIVTVANTVTVSTAIATSVGSYASVTINSGASVTFSAAAGTLSATTVTNNGTLAWTAAGTLDIAAGGTLTNNSTFTCGTGTVDFLGAGTENGSLSAITFNNITINGTLAEAGPAVTIAGILLINAGNLTATPTYTGTSTLTYNVNYGPYLEWTGNGTTAGYGIPQNVTIEGTAVVTMPTSGPLGLAGNLSVAGTGSLILSGTYGADLYVGGNWTRAAGTTFTPSTSAVFFDGSDASTITVSGGETFSYLLLTGGGNATMASAVSVTGTLTLTSGLLILGTNSLTLASPASGYSSSSYIVTNSTGTVKQTAGTSAVTIPVGASATATTYAPVTITGSSSTVYTCSVATPYPGTVLVPAQMVNLAWAITASSAQTASISYQWNAANDAASFVPTIPCDLGVYNGTAYSTPYSTFTPTGTSPTYTLATNTIAIPASGTNRFVIGNAGCIICNSYSSPTCVTSPAAATGNASTIVTWTAPTCYTNVMVVVSPVTGYTGGTPSGSASGYTGSLAYGSGTAFGNGYVVYVGNTSSQTVTGLTNGTTYNVTFYTNTGTVWTTCSQVTVTPGLNYCIPTSSSSSTYFIDSFYTTGGLTSNITNFNITPPASGYANFTSQSVSQAAGSSINFYVTGDGGGANTYGFAIWVDWNNDGTFESGEEMYSTTAYQTFATGSFAVPGGTAAGSYRMRVFADYYNAAPTNPCAFNALGPYGEAQDYTFTVLTPCLTVTPSTTPSLCAGSSVTITASGGTGYTWSTGATTASITVSPGASTSYTVTPTGTCTIPAVVTVTVNSVPAALTVTPATATICSGTVQPLAATGGLYTQTLLTEGFEEGFFPPTGWVNQSGSSNTNVWGQVNDGEANNGSGAAEYIYNSTLPGSAYLIAPGLALTAGITYTVSYWEVTEGLAERLSLTVGTAQTIAAQRSGTYLQTVQSYTNTNYAQRTFTYSPATSGTYYFAWIDTSAKNKEYIDIDDISITGMMHTDTWSPITGLYTNAAGTVPYTTGGVDSTIYAAPTTTTTYTATSTSANGCTATNTAAITVNTASIVPTSLNASSSTVCGGSSTTLTQTGGSLGTGANWQWYTDNLYSVPIGSAITSADASLSVSPTTTTTYYLRAVNGTSPCATNVPASPYGGEPSITITVSQPSTAPTGVSGNTTVCSGASTTLTATGGTLGAGANYQWGTGTVTGTNPISGATSVSYTFTPTSSNTYWVSVTVSGTCGSPSGGGSAYVTLIANQWIGGATGATTDWNTTANWCSGIVPTATTDVFISSGGYQPTIGASATIAANCGNISLNTGATLTMANASTLTIASGASYSSFGSFVAGNGAVILAGSASINSTSPISFYDLIAKGGITNNATTTVTDSFKLNTGGYISNGSGASLNYGSSSFLVYNTGGTYSVGTEWSGNGTTAGNGIPQNVIIQNSTTLSMPTSSRGLAGNLNITSGALTLNSSSGDLYIAGNWTRAAAATFTPNSRAVFFDGSATQVVTVTGGGTETFNYLLVGENSSGASTAGTMQLSSSPATGVAITSAGGLTLASSNASATIDLNGQTMTLSGGGNLNIVSGSRYITSSATGGIFKVTTASTAVSGGGASGMLTFGTNTILDLQDGFNCGLNGTNSYTTINSMLEIDGGGYINTYAPTYAANSILNYNGVTAYNALQEWYQNTYNEPGYPYNVTLTNNASVNFSGEGYPHEMGGSLTINPGSSFTLAASGLGPAPDLYVKGNWINNGTFTSNGHMVQFNGSAAAQALTGVTAFDSLWMNNSLGLTLNSNISVNTTLVMGAGMITAAAADTVTLNSAAANSITGYSSTKYINGYLKRYVAGSTSYDFPIGTAGNYELANINFTGSLAGTSFLVGSFDTTNNGTVPDTAHTVIDSSQINQLLSGGYWTISCDAEPTLGTYDATLYMTAASFSNAPTTHTNTYGKVVPPRGQIGLVKRSNSSGYWIGSGGNKYGVQQGTGVNDTTVAAITATSAVVRRTAIPSFSDFGIGIEANYTYALPVELIYFSAEKNGNDALLNWATASEINNAYFDIQRSTDGVTFEKIGQVAGAGNSTETINYAYTDNTLSSVNAPVVYYRLKQVDVDNNSQYSNIASVDITTATPVFKIISMYPNPFSDHFSVSYFSPESQSVTMSIYDVRGALVSEETVTAESGMNIYSIPNAARLANGFYTMNINAGLQNYGIKMLKGE